MDERFPIKTQSNYHIVISMSTLPFEAVSIIQQFQQYQR